MLRGRGEASVEGPVQRSSAPDVLRYAGRPLAGPLRAEMEARLGADFSDVRLHTGTAAQRSAQELGARAYTSGSHVVIGQGGGDRHTLAHELTHVIQQRQGPVAGTDNGSGLKVSDPSDRFEQAAERNARAALARPVPERDAGPAHEGDRERSCGETPHVQRYAVVHPGTAQYPVLGTVDANGRPGAAAQDFFPGQVARPRMVKDPHTGEEEPVHSFVDADGNLNIEYRGQVPLRLAGNLDLAVEDTGNDPRQAKTFFATEKRINQTNERLRGRVSLDQTDNYMTLRRTTKILKIITRDKELTLWQVVPVVNRPATVLRPATQQRGLDVRLAQRCNEIATEVTGKQGLADSGEGRYFNALADVLGHLSPDRTAEQFRAPLERARQRAIAEHTDAAATALSGVMANMIRSVMAYRDDPAHADRLKAAYAKFKLNEFTPPAGIGDVFMIKALKGNATSGGLDFHFAGVVAKSGEDHVTMENYARHEEAKTLSGGDPQWYFQMYGPRQNMQSFHEQWGWERRFTPNSGEGNRLVLTILLQG
ncbi:hypothetical protein SSP24_80520 [Streptomyces spinoverrucosus]|uniref:eCIS core domain-containing protein n=1 Tax=Streptomyces spinoverrucosus TaxID=284043 RepID=A0A4Y3VU63_9ACTN|nr:hypothetical protein SSP24_80520 [Streptomyces spinoverrucosus]GHB93865.1 hypothetical protein GCM10010397_78400 [Streptomyces spinoverrucosus]